MKRVKRVSVMMPLSMQKGSRVEARSADQRSLFVDGAAFTHVGVMEIPAPVRHPAQLHFVAEQAGLLFEERCDLATARVSVI
jgi:hypothetical protein